MYINLGASFLKHYSRSLIQHLFRNLYEMRIVLEDGKTAAISPPSGVLEANM